MISRRVLATLAVAIGFTAATGTLARAQEPSAPKDEALDSLLQKLSDPSDQAGKTSEKTSPPKKEGRDPKDSDAAAKAKEAGGGPGGSKRPADATGPSAAKDGKPPVSKPDGSRPLAGKDQEVDELLKKLGETTETPSPNERPPGGAGGGENPEGRRPAPGPDKTDRSRLTGKDKETDEHLEELAGRKRRKKGDNEERSGPAGEIIKEMRDIEQKLNKPDTGEATREEQKKVVKRIETLIEEMKQSGQSSMGRLGMRRVRRPGQQQPGQQRGSNEGALARGAPLSKPAKPTTKHSNAGGRDIWGHLPPEMRQEIENQWDELPLTAKRELIDRYYLSVNKGKPVREETP
jgi:hypothetical protein